MTALLKLFMFGAVCNIYHPMTTLAECETELGYGSLVTETTDSGKYVRVALATVNEDSFVTRGEASSYCLCEYNTALASIHSIDDNNDIIGDGTWFSNHGTTWIGLDDLGIENKFLWDDGSYFDYDGFSTGGRNNWNNQDCVAIDSIDGKWFDFDCTGDGDTVQIVAWACNVKSTEDPQCQYNNYASYCSAYDDNNIKTFNSLFYKFDGYATYDLVAPCNNNDHSISSGIPFEIGIEYDPDFDENLNLKSQYRIPFIQTYDMQGYKTLLIEMLENKFQVYFYNNGASGNAIADSSLFDLSSVPSSQEIINLARFGTYYNENNNNDWNVELSRNSVQIGSEITGSDPLVAAVMTADFNFYDMDGVNYKLKVQKHFYYGWTRVYMSNCFYDRQNVCGLCGVWDSNQRASDLNVRLLDNDGNSVTDSDTGLYYQSLPLNSENKDIFGHSWCDSYLNQFRKSSSNFFETEC